MCKFAAEGNKEQLKRLIVNGIEVNESNYDQRTALHLAASEGHVDVVEYLLEKKADANFRDRTGGTPLSDALRHKHERIQEILRMSGGQLKGIDIATELCSAAAEGDVAKLKALIVNGANPESADANNRTALHLAASNGEVTVLDHLVRLLDPPMNLDALDSFGGTPLDDAYRHGKRVAIAILED
ncbi:hypothetical protein GUITHDRAFT_73954, partial [Guillardia theta CCMP2712]